MSYSVVQQKLTQHCKSTMRACMLSCFSRVQLFATPWTVAHQALLSTRLSRQEYWSGLSCPSSGDLSNPGTEPVSPCGSCIAGRFFYQGSHQESFPLGKPQINYVWVLGGFSRVWLFATPWTVAHQAPLSMGFSRQEYWTGLPFPPPGDLPNPEIESVSLKSPALAGRFFTTIHQWLFFFKI